MTAANLCLTFLHLAGSSTAFPPPTIQELIKQRIVHQWTQRGEPVTEIHFDDPACAHQGNYRYTERSMVLSADTDEWRGPLEVALTSLIEGEKVPFERVAKSAAIPAVHSNTIVSVHKGKTSFWGSWMPWTLAALGVAATGYIWIEREQHVHELQGLALKF